MRQIDQPVVEVSLAIAKSPSDIWPHVIDVSLPARYETELAGAEWLDIPGLGARFTGHSRNPRAEWSTTCFVTAFTVNEVFEYVVESVEAPVATWRYSLSPAAEGTTVTFRAQLGLARNGMSHLYENDPEAEDRILTRRLEEWRKNMTRTLEGLKSLVTESY